MERAKKIRSGYAYREKNFNKKTARGQKGDLGVQKAGVEPARVLSPLDFESSASANSATSAKTSKRKRVGDERFELPTSCL